MAATAAARLSAASTRTRAPLTAREAVVIAVLSVLCAWVAETSSIPSGRIAFVSDRGGTKQIWAIDADGSDLRKLTDLRGRHCYLPTWSPDGSMVAFASTAHPEFEELDFWRSLIYDTYVAASAGGQPVRINGPYECSIDPLWSPDSSGVVVVGRLGGDYAAGGMRLLYYDVATGDTRPLAEGGYVASPAWSPDGTSLAFFRAEPRNAIEIVNPVTGGTLASYPLPGPPPEQLMWLRQEELYAVMLERDEPYLVRIALGQSSAPSVTECLDGLLLWCMKVAAHSADGSRIAVARGGDICLLETSWGDVRVMTAERTEDSWDEHPAFSPDGRVVAFTRFYECGWSEQLARRVWRADIWAGDIQTGNSWNVTQDQLHYNGEPAWCLSPAQSRPRTAAEAVATSAPAYRSEGQELIAFVRDGSIWVMAPDGTGQTQLTDSVTCDHPCWSPDGEYLVFENTRNIWRLDLADGSRTRLTATGDCQQPAWRPDSDEVWYCRVGSDDEDREYPVEVWSVGTTTGVTTRHLLTYTNDPELSDRTSWRPDGAMVALDVGGYDEPSVQYYGLDGLDLRNCSYSLGAWGSPPQARWYQTDAPAWSPSNQSVLATARTFVYDDGRWVSTLTVGDVQTESAFVVFQAPRDSFVSWLTCPHECYQLLCGTERPVKQPWAEG